MRPDPPKLTKEQVESALAEGVERAKALGKRLNRGCGGFVPDVECEDDEEPDALGLKHRPIHRDPGGSRAADTLRHRARRGEE